MCSTKLMTRLLDIACLSNSWNVDPIDEDFLASFERRSSTVASLDAPLTREIDGVILLASYPQV